MDGRLGAEKESSPEKSRPIGDAIMLSNGQS